MRGRIASQPAFSLFEILLATVTIVILVAMVIAAVNPKRRLADTRDSNRKVDLKNIGTALYEYNIDNNGKFLPGLDKTWKIIGTDSHNCRVWCGSGSGNYAETSHLQFTADQCLDFSPLVPRYLLGLPSDPLNGTDQMSFYAVRLDSNNRVLLRACNAEMEEVIEIAR